MERNRLLQIRMQHARFHPPNVYALRRSRPRRDSACSPTRVVDDGIVPPPLEQLGVPLTARAARTRRRHRLGPVRILDPACRSCGLWPADVARRIVARCQGLWPAVWPLATAALAADEPTRARSGMGSRILLTARVARVKLRATTTLIGTGNTFRRDLGTAWTHVLRSPITWLPCL